MVRRPLPDSGVMALARSGSKKMLEDVDECTAAKYIALAFNDDHEETMPI